MPYDEDRTRLLELVRSRALLERPVTLSSGAQSTYYVDGKQLTLSPEAAPLLVRILLGLCRRYDVSGIGGPTIGADPVVGAVVAASGAAGWPVKGFLVRPAGKGHGLRRRVEGPPLGPEDRLLLFDDVVTTGGSLLSTLDPLRESGARIVCATCIVDREEGAAEAFGEAGIRFEPILCRSDLDLGSTNE